MAVVAVAPLRGMIIKLAPCSHCEPCVEADVHDQKKGGGAASAGRRETHMAGVCTGVFTGHMHDFCRYETGTDISCKTERLPPALLDFACARTKLPSSVWN